MRDLARQRAHGDYDQGCVGPMQNLMSRVARNFRRLLKR